VKRLRFGLAFALTLTVPFSALAQGTMFPAPAPADSAAAQPEPSVEATAPTPAPVQTAAPPVVVVAPPVPAVPPQGQWVYTETYGWIWVPQGTTSVVVQERPYVYLYTPVYGWTWYGSPWGPGAYYAGPWVHHGFGPARVWHRGDWYAPRVVVRSRVAAPAYRGGRGGSHRGRR
jgi:hypothetical protein